MKIKKVVYKKIPKKENALGLAHNSTKDKKAGIIEIEKNQTPLAIFDTEIHEWIHMKYPEMPEESVEKMATKLSRFLWGLGYRKT